MSVKDKPRLLIKDGQPLTTSLAVAEHFEKAHKNVLRDIRNLDCSEEFHRLNFEQVFHLVPGNNGAMRKMPYYEMTKDGFTRLVFGFTGHKAAAWQEAYIAAFNAMANALTNALANDLCNQRVLQLQQQLEELDELFEQYRAGIRQAVQLLVGDVSSKQRKVALAETAKLQMQHVAEQLGVPALGWPNGKGSIVSVLYLILLFACRDSRPDATLLWLLVEAHDDCLFGQEAVRITASTLLRESEGQLASTDSIYKSRQRLIANRLLLPAPPGLWRINRQFLHARLCEIQASAYLKKHPLPWLTAEEGGVDESIQAFLTKLEAFPVPAPTHQAPGVLQ